MRAPGRVGINAARHLRILAIMTNSIALPCDGCGQAATAEHIARRLQRLEWTTRYRPVHIHTLLLGAYSPSLAYRNSSSRNGEYAPSRSVWMCTGSCWGHIPTASRICAALPPNSPSLADSDA